MLDPQLSLTFSLMLAVIFIASGLSKFRQLAVFTARVEAYELLPARLVPLVSVMLPGLELILALLLLPTATRPFAAAALLALLLVFSLAIGFNILRGHTDIDCGCFLDGSEQHLSAWLLLRNGLLVLGGAALLLPVTGRAMHPLDVVLALLAVFALGLGYLTVNTLIANNTASQTVT